MGLYNRRFVVLVAGWQSFPVFSSNLLPEFKERDFLMHWLTKPGTSAAGRDSGSPFAACNELREIPGVRNCASHIGQAFLADEPYGVNFGENWISVDPAVTTIRLWPQFRIPSMVIPGSSMKWGLT